MLLFSFFSASVIEFGASKVVCSSHYSSFSRRFKAIKNDVIQHPLVFISMAFALLEDLPLKERTEISGKVPIMKSVCQESSICQL